jgi:hypothetical protein
VYYEETTMFSAHCPEHGAEVLLGYGNLIGVENTDKGVVVHWRCFCGTRGHTLTGRRRHPSTV